MKRKACFWVAFFALFALTAQALNAAEPYLNVPVKSAAISYKMIVPPLSEGDTQRVVERFVTVFISDNGAAVAQYGDTATSLAKDIIVRDGFFYTLESGRKAALKTPLEQSLMHIATNVPLRRAQDMMAGRGMARGAAFNKIGTERVAGVMADRYESKYPNGKMGCMQRDAYSIYKGMVLKAELGLCNTTIMIYEATRYAEDQADVAKKTILPEGYKVIDQTAVQAARTAAWAPQSLKVTYDSTVDGGIYKETGKRIRYISGAEKSVELWNAARAYDKKTGLPPEQIALRTIIDHKEHTLTVLNTQKRTYTTTPARGMRTASPRDVMVMQMESSGQGNDSMRIKGTSSMLGRECVNMEINAYSTLMEVCSWYGVFLTRTDYICLDPGRCTKRRLQLQETASDLETDPAMDKELFSIPEGFTRR